MYSQNILSIAWVELKQRKTTNREVSLNSHVQRLLHISTELRMITEADQGRVKA